MKELIEKLKYKIRIIKILSKKLDKVDKNLFNYYTNDVEEIIKKMEDKTNNE